MITDLITEIMNAMEETSPMLSTFDLSNPDAIYKDNDIHNAFLKTMIDHYKQPITDRYENHTTRAIPVINTPQTKVEFEEFMEELDGAVTSLNKKFTKNVNQLVTMQKLKSSGVDNYLQVNIITSTDVYKYLSADGMWKNYSNMALLFKISLLIAPSTSNVELGFLVMNLLCTPLRSSLSETNLNQFMRMCVNGPTSFTDAQCEEVLNNFKVMNNNRRLDL